MPERSLLKIATALSIVVLLYFVWLHGGLWVRGFVKPWVVGLDEGTLKSFLLLDRGRLWTRMFFACWTLAVYAAFLRLFHKKSLKDAEVVKAPAKWPTFAKGVAVGACLVIPTIALPWVFGALRFTAFDAGQLFPTLLLYLFAMLLTASMEEVVFRSFMMGTLAPATGRHFAVIAVSVAFAFGHASSSWLYAVMAGLIGVILGYTYFWYGIYFPIGVHLAWNWIETSVFSARIVHFEMLDPVLAGDRIGRPDKQGLLSLPSVIIGLIVLAWSRRRSERKRLTG